MGFPKAVLVCVLSLAAILSVVAVPVTAIDRSDGDYWVYESSMYFEDAISVSGEYRYEFEEKDSLTMGSETYDVNVLRVTGSMAGEADDYLGMTASVEMIFDGYVYKVDGSMARVKETMHTWANVTTGIGSLVDVDRMEMHHVSTFSPPVLSGFVEGETGTGDEWEETTNVSSASTTWVDGVIDRSSTDEYTSTCSYSVAAAEENVTTEAGTFACLKITVTDDWGNHEVYWYSSEVGNWVKECQYLFLASAPVLTLELTEYEYSTDSRTAMLILSGVGILVAVVVIVAILMFMRRKGQSPAQAPLETAQPPGPPL